jgi:hypothetical protein
MTTACRYLPLLFMTACAYASSGLDTFGIPQFYPTKPGTRVWTSAHWNNGIERTIKYESDPYDPTDWTEDHSSGTDGFRIDGKGVMTMSGSGPRFHINSLDSLKVPKQFYRDVEFTAYYQRHGTAGQNWGGMVVGLRSGPLGHASAGGNDCDATTYYARFRNDGKWDFEKELKHPGSTYWSGSGYNTQDPLWNGSSLPLNRWIGMKYIVYNFQSNSRVRLEVYIDSVSNGIPGNPAVWKKVGAVVDSGTWPSGDVSGCSYAQNAIILQGNGTVLMRTDGDTACYKMVSIREITVSDVSLARSDKSGGRQASCFKKYAVSDKPGRIGRLRNVRVYSIQGRLNPVAPHRDRSPGVYIIRMIP